MKPLSAFKSVSPQIVFTDIDDTLTHEGKLLDTAYHSLWRLSEAGIDVVPVTGRPAGWCELIARQWPVRGVIGENGAFYFCHDHQRGMVREYYQNESERKKNQEKLQKIREDILKKVPRAQVASDQFCRLFDLAIDFSEDVRPDLSKKEVQTIVATFEHAGATAKVSSIHVNGWFGNYDKLTMCQIFCEKEMGWKLEAHNSKAIFVGDSPNDEPMFRFFANSIGVANVQSFIEGLQNPPKFVASKEGGEGFAEIAQKILGLRSSRKSS